MNKRNIILIEASTPDFEALKRAVARAEETGSYIRFYLEPAETHDVFEPGDQVRAEADTGTITAEVVADTPDGIKIRYGHGGKYTATVARWSVHASKTRTIPACLKWKAYEGEWTPGVESHRPNGGYPA